MRSPLSLLLLLTVTSMSLAQGMAPPKADLKKLEASYTSSKAVFAKKPKDAAAKKKYVAATVAFGTATMMSDKLAPRVKYVGALRLYREALKFDPKNKEALTNKNMIEGIYRDMGKPIPK